jgi:FemAB-related protein (PEP-CTERM system-associated)
VSGRAPLSDTAVRVDRYAGERDAWDAFVARSPSSTFFHRSTWLDVVEQTFGYGRHDLVARRGGHIVGILPLCEVPRPFGRACLMSLPFAVQAGVCADDGEARQALDAEALALGLQRKAEYVELRDGPGGDGFRAREGVYFGFRRALHANDEDNLRSVPRKQRRMIRVGQRSGLRAEVGPAHLGAFHDLYARTARRLGSPVFAVGYFRLLLDTLGDDCVLMTVWQGGVAVAGVLSFFFRDTVLPYYAGSRRDMLRFAPNDFLYWELMRHAVRRGARAFDFGRSKVGSGPFAFKRHWGFVPEPQRYRVCAFGNDPPVRSLDDPWVRWLRRCWSQMPLSLTKVAGPMLIRRLGPYYT